MMTSPELHTHDTPSSTPQIAATLGVVALGVVMFALLALRFFPELGVGQRDAILHFSAAGIAVSIFLIALQTTLRHHEYAFATLWRRLPTAGLYLILVNGLFSLLFDVSSGKPLVVVMLAVAPLLMAIVVLFVFADMLPSSWGNWIVDRLRVAALRRAQQPTQQPSSVTDLSHQDSVSQP